MIWELLDSGPGCGTDNMLLDMQLAAECRENHAILRFYRWEPYCISLGANQKLEEINADKARAEGFDIVKRPTGGRAVFHAEELTYSVVMPARCGLSSKEIYSRISLAIVRGLHAYDSLLENVELETIQPDFSRLLASPASTACFASTAKSEIKFHNKKLVGSAQRKMNNSILQHGSLLCGDYHKRIIDFLNIDDSKIAAISDELNGNTIDLKEITGRETDYNELQKSIAAGFQEEWEMEF